MSGGINSGSGLRCGGVLTAAAPAKTWTVLTTSRRETWPTGGYSTVLDAHRLASASEYPLGIVKGGTPILLSDKGELDEWLVLYFTSCPKFTSLDLLSRRTYALEIAMWCGFLGRQADPLMWLEATEDDFIDYKIRRTDHHQFADTVAGGSTWNKAVFALRDLYDWAVSRKIPIGPNGPQSSRTQCQVGGGVRRGCPVGGRTRYSCARSGIGGSSRGTYRLWRDVGLRGRGIERVGPNQWRTAGEDKSCRVRNSLRNTVFTDFVYSTGLRVQEAGSLLLAELPTEGVIEAKLPAAIAKYSKARMCTRLRP